MMLVTETRAAFCSPVAYRLMMESSGNQMIEHCSCSAVRSNSSESTCERSMGVACVLSRGQAPCDPTTVARQIPLSWDYPGKNTKSGLPHFSSRGSSPRTQGLTL